MQNNLIHSLNLIKTAAIDIAIIIIVPACRIGSIHEPFKELHEIKATKTINVIQNILFDMC